MQLILQYIISIHYTSSPFIPLFVEYTWARGESRAVFLYKLTCMPQSLLEVKRKVQEKTGLRGGWSGFNPDIIDSDRN